jgi:hypothetical protein
VKRLLLGALLLAVFPAIAQTPRTATITFARPTQYVDGSALGSSVAVSYKVFQGAKGSTSKALVGTITSTSASITSGIPPGETCWQVSVVASGGESALSNEACKTFAFPSPETVTITVN